MKIQTITNNEFRFLRMMGFNNPGGLNCDLLHLDLYHRVKGNRFTIKRVEDGQLIVRNSNGDGTTIWEPWLNISAKTISQIIREVESKL